MYKNALRPAWAEINLSNLDFNIKNIKAKIGDREMIGVIKADAYGHGSVKVAEVLRANGCKTFAVATLHEALTLREGGLTEDIIILGLTPDMYASTIVDYGFTPVVNDAANAAAIDAAAKAAGQPGAYWHLRCPVRSGLGQRLPCLRKQPECPHPPPAGEDRDQSLGAPLHQGGLGSWL